MHPDQKYIDALTSNNTQLLRELYEKFHGRIVNMVVQNNGTQTEAADIFQDALLSIYNKARSGEFILSCPLDAFLYLICRNNWLKELEKRKHRGVTFRDPDGYIPISDDNFRLAEECLTHQARKNLLMDKLALLGASCRKLLLLSWDGNSMGEVAEMLQVTYSYARKKKSECMARLIGLVRKSPQFNSLKW
jgi:RNA polymerase sigma factor (sigma-70 family)